MAAEAPEEDGPPSEADLREYAQTLGVDFDTQPELRWAVLEAFNAPLPTSWSEHTDDEERVYFFHEATNESTWVHPMDVVYRELLDFAKQVTSHAHPVSEDERLAIIQDHLRQVHHMALEKLEGWSGPYAAEAGEYYYNEALKLSTWESPLMEWEQELYIRHSVLCRCLLPDYSASSGADAAASAAGGEIGFGPDLLSSLQLPLGLIRRDDSGDTTPPEAPSARSFHTARSGLSARSQQLSGRNGSGEKLQRLPAASRHARKSSRSPGPAGRHAPGGDDDGDCEFTFGSTNKVQLPSFAAST